MDYVKTVWVQTTSYVQEYRTSSCGARLPNVRLFGIRSFEYPTIRHCVAPQAELSCSQRRTTWELQANGAEVDRHVTLILSLARFARRRCSRRRGRSSALPMAVRIFSDERLDGSRLQSLCRSGQSMVLAVMRLARVRAAVCLFVCLFRDPRRLNVTWLFIAKLCLAAWPDRPRITSSGTEEACCRRQMKWNLQSSAAPLACLGPSVPRQRPRTNLLRRTRWPMRSLPKSSFRHPQAESQRRRRRHDLTQL